jgi:peptide/nickel transport system permease protein
VSIFMIGNPVDVLANPNADQKEMAEIAARLGLDKPLWEQFALFVWNGLHGDLGRSFVFNEPALKLIIQRMPATMELALLALVFSIAIGIPLGVIAGLYPDNIVGRSIMGGSILGFSLPNFWIGLMLILLFAVQLRWLPSGGRGPTTDLFGLKVSFLTWEGLRYLILPAVTLSLYKAALVIRLARAGTREVMLQDYIRFARAKGLSRRRIVMVHVLKAIMIPIVTVLGLELGGMIAFAVVTETVFAYPGMGKLLIDSIGRLDRPVIVAYLMLVVVLFVVINFVVDLVYAALDPRVRLSEAKA